MSVPNLLKVRLLMGNNPICNRWKFDFVPLSSTFVLRSLIVFLTGAFLNHAWAGGPVLAPTHANFAAALAGGGTVSFECDGTVSLTNTITCTTNTLIDGNGHNVVISGGNALRLFQLETNVTLSMRGLALANGLVVGTNGAGGHPAQNGQDAFGAGILNLGGMLVLNDCWITNHSVLGGKGGNESGNTNYSKGGDGMGAAICAFGGSVLLTNCHFSQNIAVGGDGGDAAADLGSGQTGNAGAAIGGAMYTINTTIAVQGGELIQNKVIGGISGNISYRTGMSGDGVGGAVYVTNSILYVGGALLASNKAIGGDQYLATSVGNGAGWGIGGALFLSPNSTGTISSVVLSDNSSAAGACGRNSRPGFGMAGAIYNAGALQLQNCTLATNTTTGTPNSLKSSSGFGGAIYSTNQLEVNDCSFLANLAIGAPGIQWPYSGSGGPAEGGAIWNSGRIGITNSTLALNKALAGTPDNAASNASPGRGGGLCLTSGPAFLVNVTIVSNEARGGSNDFFRIPGASEGGGVFATNNTTLLINTLLATNNPGGNFAGVMADGGNNLSSDASCAFTAEGSLNLTDPKLAPLDNYGGSTVTYLLLGGSPAIDGGKLAAAPPVDQRGHSRPFGSAPDIGAFESSPPFIVRGRLWGSTFDSETIVNSGNVTTSTTNHGFYNLEPPTGPAVITPSEKDYFFVPPAASITVGPDVIGLDFHAYRWNALSFEAADTSSLHVTLAGTNGATYEVLSSPDLKSWTPFSTNVMGPSQLLDFSLPISGTKGFYRSVMR
jgi:hypothetical protein